MRLTAKGEEMLSDCEEKEECDGYVERERQRDHTCDGEVNTEVTGRKGGSSFRCVCTSVLGVDGRDAWVRWV
jgi:hypothetical protein